MILRNYWFALHASGLEGLGFFSHFVLGRRARVAAHPDVARRLWDGHLAAGMEQLAQGERAPVRRTLENYFELVPLRETGAVAVGPFEIECRFTRHHIPTTAFRITAGGRRAMLDSPASAGRHLAAIRGGRS